MKEVLHAAFRGIVAAMAMTGMRRLTVNLGIVEQTPPDAILGQKARGLMERLLRISSPLGLYAEEFDAPTGRHLGNFPQAFSHLALIEAAARIVVPEMLEEY